MWGLAVTSCEHVVCGNPGNQHDLPAFRRHFNLQTVYLRGLDIAPVAGLLPSCEAGDDVVRSSYTKTV